MNILKANCNKDYAQKFRDLFYKLNKITL